jgi:hypothetical protein
MHGEGERRRCPHCHQNMSNDTPDSLSNRELRGPREITSSDIDRVFDDAGRRFLFVEEKAPNEHVPRGQDRMLRALAALPHVDVWGVRGTPDRLRIVPITPTGADASRVIEGDFDAYQRAVLTWFTRPISEHNSEWMLDELSGVPFTAPEWCPPETWQEFDRLLTAVLSVRSA